MTPQDVEILLLGVLVALPVLTGVWATVWSMIWKAFRFLGMMLVVEKRAFRPDGRAVIIQHLGGRVLMGGPEQFDCTSRFVSTLSARRMIFERNQNDGWRLYLVGWCPLLYVEKTEDSGRFFYLRGTLDWLRFLKRIEDAHDVWVQRERVLRERRFCVSRVAGADEQIVYKSEGPPTASPVKYGGFVPYLWPEEEGRAVDLVGATLDDLALTPALREVVDDVRFWVDHRDWYRDRGVAWRRGYLFHGGPGTGKCLGQGTPVLMFDGSIKKVEEVVEGDLLMGPDSRPRRVLGTTVGRETMYRVTPIKGDPYTVNESHILSIKFNGEIMNLSVRDWLRSSPAFRARAKGWRTGVDFTSGQDLPLDPYLLGVWLGDGTASRADVTTADPEIEVFLREQVETMRLSLSGGYGTGKAKTWSLSTSDHGGKGCPRDTRNPMTHWLRKLRVWKNKNIPNIYKTASRKDRLSLLAGLIDTDRYLSCGGYEITQKSKILADDIAYLARSLGMAAYVARKEAVCSNSPTKARGVYWRVFISGEVSVIPVKLPRKRSAKRQQIKDVLVTGISVEEIGPGDYYGFELDQDGLFLLGDFTVTHNSSMVRAIGEALDIPVTAMDLSAMSNKTFGQAWANANAYGGASHIVLLEDFDAVFYKRQRQDPSSKLTFDAVLNAIDGLERPEGLILIVTTNDPEAIDSALGAPLAGGGSTRPGRIDLTVAFGPLDEEGRRKVASRIVRDPEWVAEVVAEGAGLSPARFQELCCQKAMRQLWGRRAA